MEVKPQFLKGSKVHGLSAKVDGFFFQLRMGLKQTAR